jgi:ribosomal protein L40E
MICPKCGTINVKGAKFCEKCGTSLITGNVCPKCGHKNKTTARHCIECGTDLTGPTVVESTLVEEAKPKEKIIKPRKPISPAIWVLGGALLVVVLFMAAFLLRVVKVPTPPQPNTSTLPEIVVSAWTGAYQFQTTGSFALPTASIAQGSQGSQASQSDQASQGSYVDALFNCDEKGKSPVSASTNDKIHDSIRWIAGTQAQVEDFLKYIQYNVFVDEKKVDFQGPYQYEIKFDSQNDYYATPSLVVLDSLAVGTHHIRTQIT